MKNFIKKYGILIALTLGFLGIISLLIWPSLVGTIYATIIVEYNAWFLSVIITIMVVLMIFKFIDWLIER